MCLLNAIDLGRDPRDGLLVRHRAEPGGGDVSRLERREQPVRMRALQVSLDALRAQHAAVEREVLPRLEADDLVVLHLQLDAALLAAETAMRLHESLGLDARRQAHARHRREMRPEPFDDLQIVCGDRCHD